MNKSGLEIERKYLIRMPDEARLAAMPGCETWEILQTYLKGCGNGYSNRVRRIRVNGEEKYIQTEKKRVSAMSAQESERELSRSEYRELLESADPGLNAIDKKRYRIPYADQLLEIDVYSFWNDRATLEIELTSENQLPLLPDWLEIVRELTGEPAYKNLYLAKQVPMEELP